MATDPVLFAGTDLHGQAVSVTADPLADHTLTLRVGRGWADLDLTTSEGRAANSGLIRALTNANDRAALAAMEANTPDPTPTGDDDAEQPRHVTAADAYALPEGSVIRWGSSPYPLTLDAGVFRATPADRLGYTLSPDTVVEVLAHGASTVAETGGGSRA